MDEWTPLYSTPARPSPMRTPAWVYCGTRGLLYRIQVRVMGAAPFAMRSPAAQHGGSQGHACAAAMTWDMPAGRWAVWANGLWGTLALSDNLEMPKLLGKCNPQVWLAEDYMNATGRLVSPSAPVATPLWNSGQAVTSADAPPPGACCASAHHYQTQPHECSATLKSAQELMLVLSLKDFATILNLTQTVVDRAKRHSIHWMHQPT